MNHEDTPPVRPADDREQPAAQAPSTATTGAPGDSTAPPADDGTATAAPAATVQAGTTAVTGMTDTGSSANVTPPADEARPADSTAAAAGKAASAGESPAAAQATTPTGPNEQQAGTTPPAIVLPADIEALDNQLQAALVMVGRGINRLSRLAGNIRFAFLQRDESRLANERKALKEGFARQEKTEAELKFGLQAVLQKAERLAGSLLYVPAAPASGQGAPAQPDAAATPLTAETGGPGPDAIPAPATPPPASTADTDATPPSPAPATSTTPDTGQAVTDTTSAPPPTGTSTTPDTDGVNKAADEASAVAAVTGPD